MATVKVGSVKKFSSKLSRSSAQEATLRVRRMLREEYDTGRANGEEPLSRRNPAQPNPPLHPIRQLIVMSHIVRSDPFETKAAVFHEGTVCLGR